MKRARVGGMAKGELLDIDEDEFLRMEEAISSTAQGRAFLRMRDRRTRLLATDEWRRLGEEFGRQLDRLSAVEPRQAADGASSGDAAHLRILRQELHEMSAYIQQTRNEIAALRPDDAGTNRIMAATGELDAVVTATERATTEILNAAERVQDQTAKLHRLVSGNAEALERVDAIEAQCIEIMTACSFQDITGQRTTKVVNTLRYIEQRVNTMIEIWGIGAAAASSADARSSHRKPGDDRPDAHLLNGPALGDGIDQAAVDEMFDTPTPGGTDASQADIDGLFK
ncbi:MAG TPA: hypothetical protein VK943_08375 [Arenibaculum sp.]|nr:hypothetical protein [Arenibaculum sp.]